MRWLLNEIQEKSFPSPTKSPHFFAHSPPPPLLNAQSDALYYSNKVSPIILAIIIILAVIFFVSGLIHLFVRFFIRPPNRDPDDLEDDSDLQGQLQQLFHLHDSGVDQSFIDSLPIFNYKDIVGVRDPFDCAICLCEFELQDELRLLPKCSHAFHNECIDTWLLSHSTCPICRASLVSDFSPNNNSYSPILLLLESGSDSFRELENDRDSINELGSSHYDLSKSSCELSIKNDPIVNQTTRVDSGEEVLTVKLGKFQTFDGGEDSNSSTNIVDSRRCFSMGSIAYVMDENSSSFQVPIRAPMKKKSNKKLNLQLTPGHKQAISECDYESRREFKFNAQVGSDNISTGRSKRESFSMSKIWLRGKKENLNGIVDSSRRAFSFRFPVQRHNVISEDLKVKNGNETRRAISEINIA